MSNPLAKRIRSKPSLFIVTCFALAEGGKQGSSERVGQLLNFLSMYYNIVYIRTGPGGSLSHVNESVFKAYAINSSDRNIVLKCFDKAFSFLLARKCQTELEQRENGQRNLSTYVKLMWLCFKYKPKAIISMYIWSLRPIVEIAKLFRVPLVLDTHDIMSIRSRAAASIGETSFEVSEEEELCRWALADTLLAIQQEEANQMKRMAPEAEVVLVEHSQGCALDAHTQPKQGRFLFVGSKSRHNVNALEYFLAEVWPQVISRFPDAELNVCGSVCIHIKHQCDS
jgi:hypothetical protein